MRAFTETKFSNIFKINGDLCTPNFVPGNNVYGEQLITWDDIEYRLWNPWRSKLAAMILNGCNQLPIQIDSNILYLGGGNGTTVSHISDIVTNGKIYCIEFSSRAFRDLLAVAKLRNNMIPILESATHPERYKTLVGQVDLIYQDISQRDQPEILMNNANHFLKPHSQCIFMVKAKSIDMTKSTAKIYEMVKQKLFSKGIKIQEAIDLSPYTKEHVGLILKI